MAIDCFSRTRKQLTPALANPNEPSRLRQSGCMSVPHALVARGDFYSYSRGKHVKGCIPHYTFSCHCDLGDRDVAVVVRRITVPPIGIVHGQEAVFIYRHEQVNGI